jgi:hypothetical protein
MIQLATESPLLQSVIQDCTANIEMTKNEVRPEELREALSGGRARFMVHDFFTPIPVRDADVYWLRYILYVNSQSRLRPLIDRGMTAHPTGMTGTMQAASRSFRIRKSMSPQSHILICEQIMETTTRSVAHSTGPCLPPNYRVHKRYSHQRDLDVIANINGIERTPAEFDRLFRQAGLALDKVWPCRSQVSILEVVWA